MCANVTHGHLFACAQSRSRPADPAAGETGTAPSRWRPAPGRALRSGPCIGPGRDDHPNGSACLAAAALSLIRVLARLTGMPNKDRTLVDRHPPKPGGEDWLVNAQEQLVVQFKPDNPSPHAEWVSVRTYSWIPPHPPVPQTRRRMLRNNAINAWKQMQKTGWQRCSPPVR